MVCTMHLVSFKSRNATVASLPRPGDADDATHPKLADVSTIQTDIVFHASTTVRVHPAMSPCETIPVWNNNRLQLSIVGTTRNLGLNAQGSVAIYQPVLAQVQQLYIHQYQSCTLYSVSINMGVKDKEA